MAGEIELLPNRGLTHIIGSDRDGLAGKMAAPDRPYWGLVADSTYGQGKFTSSDAYGKFRIPLFTKGSLLGSVVRFANFFGTGETSLGTTTITHMGLEYNGAWLGDLTFDGGSLSKIMTGTDIASTDACLFDIPAGVFAFLWVMVNNPTGLPYCPVVQYRHLGQRSASAIIDNLGALITSDMTNAEWTFSPISIEGWTKKHSVVLLENSRGIDGYNRRGALVPGDTAPAIAAVAAVANLGMSGQAMWQYGTDSTARDKSKAVLAPVTTAILVGDMVNDLSTDAVSLPGLYTKIFNKHDPAGNKLRIAKTCDPWSSLGTGMVSVLSQTAGVATATVADASKLRVGVSVVIAGATPAAFNGTKVITGVDYTSSTFTFAIASATASTATGTLTYRDGYVGQTRLSNSTQEVNRQSGNQQLRLGAIDGIHFVFDSAAVTEDPTDPSLWAPLMNPAEDSTDGLHVGRYGQAAKSFKARELAALLASSAYIAPI